jgi:hypothetical protein
LVVGTTTNDSGILGVGSNGETLVADSSASVGLRYQSAYNGNGIINGGMDIWQRGTSFALTSPGVAYTSDRWLARHLGTNVTYSQQTSGLTGIQYSLRIQRPNGVTGTNAMTIYYNMETADSYRFAGQTVTLSYWAKAGANFSGASNISSVGLYSGTGTNQNITSGALTGQATVVTQNNTLTTSWQRFSVTGTVGSTATQLAFVIFYDPTGTAGANDWMEVTGVQLELGSVATSFKRSGSGGGTLAGELAACQRYYQQIIDTVQIVGFGMRYNSTQIFYSVFAPVQMRSSTPTATITGTVYSTGSSGGGTLSSPAVIEANAGFIAVLATNSVTPTSGVVYLIERGKHTFSAEL